MLINTEEITKQHSIIRIDFENISEIEKRAEIYKKICEYIRECELKIVVRQEGLVAQTLDFTNTLETIDAMNSDNVHCSIKSMNKKSVREFWEWIYRNNLALWNGRRMLVYAFLESNQLQEYWVNMMFYTSQILLYKDDKLVDELKAEKTSISRCFKGKGDEFLNSLIENDKIEMCVFEHQNDLEKDADSEVTRDYSLKDFLKKKPYVSPYEIVGNIRVVIKNEKVAEFLELVK